MEYKKIVKNGDESWVQASVKKTTNQLEPISD